MSPKRARRPAAVAFALLLSVTPGTSHTAAAQTADANAAPPPPATRPSAAPLFRLERIPAGPDAELLTVFGSLDGLPHAAGEDADVPLVSVLRDTLGDQHPENDRLRYVWPLTYTSPTLKQRVASAIPFLYARVGNRRHVNPARMPPPVIDLSTPEREVWERFMWTALKSVVFNPYGVAVKSTTNTLTNNLHSYRQAHIIRALAILSLYESATGEQDAFTPAELAEIQGRLMLTSKTFGGLVDDIYLRRVSEKQSAQWLDARGHNWELLRQRAEAEGLYFEPLQLPDGSATHALLWVARTDLEANRARKFNKRFLNIASPWGDRRLIEWKGYTATRRLDAPPGPLAETEAGGRTVELIPLALYGLDNPKIPTLLVDFRSDWNPKRREMSHRVIEDVARNLLALSRFGDLHYFLGRTIFDYVTGRRGIDINQPSRVRAYSQLKLLLALDASLDPELRDELSRRLEHVSLNPLENDLGAEARLAREQYAALVAYVGRPDGMAARLARDRRAELVPLAHGQPARTLFRLANLFSFGLYTHREDAPQQQQLSTLDEARTLAYHRRFLREVSKSSPLIEVVWNMEDVRRSLRYVAEHGTGADSRTASAAARVFARTEDTEAKRLCLAGLYRINNETAKNELLRIYGLPALDPELRQLTAQYLRRAVKEEQRIAPADAKTIISVIGQ